MGLVKTVEEWREFRGAMTKKESAQCLSDLFLATRKKSKRSKGKKTCSFREWAVKNIGEGYGTLETHNRLLSFGGWVDELWSEVEKGLPITRAVVLARAAKERAREERIKEEEALSAVLKEFTDPANRTVQRTHAGGVTYRTKHIKRSTKPRKKAEDVDLSNVYVGKYDATNGRELWGAICDMAAAFVQTRVSELDQRTKDEITKDFAFGLRATYEDFQRELERHQRRMRHESENAELISRSVVLQACRVLQLSAPRTGEPVDMKAARSRYRTLAARFHPDRHDGDDQFVKQYHAVNEAWRAIRIYMERYPNA